MFSSVELRTLQAALPILNALSVANLECLCNAVISRIKAESTPSNEKHLGDLLQLNADQLTVCLAGLHCVLQACILHLTKPLTLFKVLQELSLSTQCIEKIVSIWALNAQSLVNRSRGNQGIQGKQLSFIGWEIFSGVTNPQLAVAFSLEVGKEQQILMLDRSQLQLLFEDLQDAQIELDGLAA